MSAMRWLVLVVVTVAVFFGAGIAGTVVALVFGQSLLGWHDNIGPEVMWGLVTGTFAALFVAGWLYRRWSSPMGAGELQR